jgi:uroporphyrinogen decarboxylase
VRQETMTPRERWLAVLRHEQPDRIPMDYWGTPALDRKLLAHLGHTEVRAMLKALHVDFTIDVAPRYVGPPLEPDVDVFGVKHAIVDRGHGPFPEPVTHPLAGFTSVDEVAERYTWPDPNWWSYADLPQQLAGFEDYPVKGGGSALFLTYGNLRGRQQAFMDFVENPDLVSYCLDHLVELAYQNTLRTLEALPGQVTISYVIEDLGGQTSLLYSPVHMRRFIFPGIKRIIELTHQAGAFVLHHDEGNILRILPELVNLGIDMLNPVQWRATGMDRELLKSQYGARLTFHGAMDSEKTLPFGTVEEVREEVLDNLRILGAGGGYVLAPCHNMQAITPVEQVVAMYAAGYEAGWL